MASKEKVDIKRSDQFQEMDELLTRAMEELDSTIDRVSLIFQTDAPLVVGEVPPDETGAKDSDAVGQQEQANGPADRGQDTSAPSDEDAAE